MKVQKPNAPKKDLDAFINAAADATISGAVINGKSGASKADENLKRQTYYIEPVYIKALGLMSEFEDTPINVLVRQFFKAGIPEEYVDQAKEILEKKSRR